ncbi:MAG: TMEM165/GDT1 family protein [Nitrospiraceae bacterium]|jgi:putative Ca2+/H+ antiporter (TMEM165/GDT1 family)|nr:MAG: TMEM165/GDT1 family protein [Nitrospiraceae bacterium]UCH45378.1 MAG: TMEM165/GDT1 family protein [Nitrospiraceae bacterium]
MDTKLFATIFATVFLAEIADKTQIATILYASNTQHNKLVVFLGSALALCLASAIAVFAGSMLSQWINGKVMSRVAGSLFIIVGIWTFLKA